MPETTLRDVVGRGERGVTSGSRAALRPIFLGTPDPFLGDNHDADGDYGVIITAVPSHRLWRSSGARLRPKVFEMLDDERAGLFGESGEPRS